MPQTTKTDTLPDDPNLVSLVARGEYDRIVLPVEASLRIRDTILLILGSVGLAVVRHMGDPQVAGLAWAFFTLAVASLIFSSVAQAVDWRLKLEGGYVPVALREQRLLYSAVAEVYFLFGIFLSSILWLPAILAGSSLMAMAIVCRQRHAFPAHRRAAAAIRAATLAATTGGSIDPQRTD